MLKLNFFDDKPVCYPSDMASSMIASYHTSMLDGTFFGTGTPNARTQKARGIFFLQDSQAKIRNAFPGWKIPRHLLFDAGTVFDAGSFNFPVFARPCPMVPRHGFVDSVVCHNSEELNAVSKQTHEVEEHAEILVTKPVSSHYNVIINGGVITFASGNDGATSGKGCNYFYVGDDPIAKLIDLDKHNIVAEGEVPFYEFVLDQEEIEKPVRLVQVRSAPHTPKVKDFVPAPVKVETILKAEGDLLAWESLLKTVDPKTTIVDHTSGSLSSHYAIHAIINKVPIFTSYVPDLGSVVEPTMENTDLNDEDKEKFFQAFVRGFSETPQIIGNVRYKKDSDRIHNVMRDILILALATLHNFSSIALSKDYEILGVVLGMFCRVAFSVSVGETRYGASLNGAKEKFKNYFKNLPVQDGRGPCYKFMMKKNHEECINIIPDVFNIFNSLSWGGSYGGKKWASCTRSTIDLFNACVNREINQVVELFNRVINEEHNGGKYLNKVISIELFDDAALDTAGFTLRNLHSIVDLLHTAWKYKAPVGAETAFKTIEIPDLPPEKVKEVNSPTEANSKVFLENADSGDPFTTLLVKEGWNFNKVQLPKPVHSISGKCHCSSCVGGHVKLFSSPFWWITSDGTKIISKVGLTKLLAQAKAEKEAKKAEQEAKQAKESEKFKAELIAELDSIPGFGNEASINYDGTVSSGTTDSNNLTVGGMKIKIANTGQAIGQGQSWDPDGTLWKELYDKKGKMMWEMWKTEKPSKHGYFVSNKKK